MGYESRFYVVEKSLVSDPDDGRWAEVVAEYNLAKCYEVSDKIRNYPITDCYIYATDGNTRIKEDCYGEPLREIPLTDLIQIVTDAMNKDTDPESGKLPYRRFQPLLSLLTGFNTKQWGELVVLHYGY